ncbi:MAG: DUF3365 domain-containing protein [Geminicoccaceae bacterium]|nr:DUF3365 domain-containing protein [Geminicoccaceae bacterium]
MKHHGFVGFCLTMTALSIYLLVTAPPPLEADEAGAEATVPIERMFDTVNRINARARQIYTKEIVGAGKRVGLKFDEEWQDERVQAGPLPALFLRETAAALERHPLPLGLFLGSDYPINPSNRFTVDQLARFQQLRADGQPQYGEVTGEGTVFGMYADIASAQACVTCHNEHKDTPKSDWRLNDTMGATTWTYPRQTVSAVEYLNLVEALYQAIASAYGLYLTEIEGFDAPPSIGDGWPRDGFFLPTTEQFIRAVREATAADALLAMAADVATDQFPGRPSSPALTSPVAMAQSDRPAARQPALEIIPATFQKAEVASATPSSTPPSTPAVVGARSPEEQIEFVLDGDSVCFGGVETTSFCISAGQQSCSVSMRPRLE